jgi:hypothetical protein
MAIDSYEMHVSSMDLYAANEIAAKVADRDQMPRTGDRHREIALHLKNASDWAQANCPSGFRVNTKVVVEFVPDVTAVYNGSRGNIYLKEKVK